MFFIEISILILSIIGNASLGIFTYLRNPRSASHRLFAIFTVVLSLWSLANYFSLHAGDDPQQILVRIRMVMFFATLLNPSIFLLVHTFPGKKIKLQKLYLFGILVLGAIIAILALSPFLFSYATVLDREVVPQPGPAMPLFAFYTLLCTGGGFITLVRKYYRAVGLERTQLRFFVFGLVTSFSLILMLNFASVVIFKVTSFISLGSAFTIILVGFISYAMVKHRLMDIRLVVARAVSYLLLVLILGLFYVFGLLSLGTLFFPEGFGRSQLYVSSFLALIGAFLFQPLRRAIEKVTDAIFYQDKYDSQEVLSHLSTIMASTLRLEELTHQVLSDLLNQTKISRGAFILMEHGKVYDFKSEGFKHPPSLSENEIEELYEQNELLVFEELPEGPIKKIMRKYDLTIASPLHVKGEEIGLLVFGEKLSGDVYTGQDIKLIEILSSEVAVAIKNAKSYEEIRRFSITLKEEVERATKELQIANEKLRELDKLKDEFISMASHELKTPTGAIRDRLWMIEHKPGKLDKKQQKHIEVAYHEAQRLIKLVNDMLNVSRIEQGRIKLALAEVNLAGVIDDVIDEYKASAEKKRLKLEFITTKKKLPKVYADADKIKIILGNLISNAIKFTEKGHIHVETYKKGDFIQVNVTDTGKGIAWQDLPKLFERFSRMESAQERVEKGTGLGLYISKKFVELMKGSIWVDSTLGKRSTFSFTLPIYSTKK